MPQAAVDSRELQNATTSHAMPQGTATYVETPSHLCGGQIK
jgi:hypothetical protein